MKAQAFKMPPMPKKQTDINTHKTMVESMANGGKPVSFSGARDTSTAAKEGRLIVDAGMKTKKKAIAKAAIKNLC